LLCPNGTYTATDEKELEDEYACTNCTLGEFCLAGRIIDNCASGFMCYEAANDYTPYVDDYAFPCRVGYFCEEGENEMNRCPYGTYTF